MSRAPFLMLAVAAATAVACRDVQSPPVTEGSVLPDSAEQMMFGVEFVLTDQGIRRAEVRADTALVYDDNTRTELRVVRTIFYTPGGEQNAVLTSNQGMHHLRLGSMEARGSVVVVSEDGRTLETPHLKFDPSRNEISSDSAFTLTEDERVTQGIGFVSNPEMSNMRILRAAQVSGTPVRIPKR
ncbi:MAG TPA: LPS export ABC transporter periplasmic protein LptC [Gemmatimonadaceae bacterium]